MAENVTEISKNLLFTKAVHLKDPGLPINYAIKKTGYYCVGTTAFSPSDVTYTATVEFRNAYGELPAAQIAKLPFYGGITIVYAVIGAYVELLHLQFVAFANRSAAFGLSYMLSIDTIYVSLPLPRHNQDTYKSLSTRAKLHHRNYHVLDC